MVFWVPKLQENEAKRFQNGSRRLGFLVFLNERKIKKVEVWFRDRDSLLGINSNSFGLV